MDRLAWHVSTRHSHDPYPFSFCRPARGRLAGMMSSHKPEDSGWGSTRDQKSPRCAVYVANPITRTNELAHTYGSRASPLHVFVSLYPQPENMICYWLDQFICLPVIETPASGRRIIALQAKNGERKLNRGGAVLKSL
eukprot:scaffold2850_cov175-Amphora_coffeaeformis.AAC.5